MFARQNLDPASLGGLIDLVGNIALGDAKARSADVLGHVFEYFLGEFALAEGKQGLVWRCFIRETTCLFLSRLGLGLKVILSLPKMINTN